MKSALVIVAMIAAVVLLTWGGLHVMVPRVNPAQDTPSDHFTSACWACHIVSDNAKLIED